MAQTPTDTAPNIWAAAAAGLVAGLAASFVMDRFQAGVAALSSSDSDAEPATEKAADKVSQAVVGHEVPDDRKPLAGQAVHYALGAGLGVVYAVAAEYRPAVTAGYGTAFALANTALLDEAAVPAVGLGDAPWKTAPSTHLYSVASHIVFGTVTEGVRRLLRGWMR
ncbi:DUF1440 domain-containing protein [Sphingomonas aurantiaca]|uniref:Putative membrane protein n=1 Tax=Sphingomonas aurantiaca TaxID=185949 RepID=A0A2T5GLV0_9SPHN|nr:DUF1440 domain-containing protein [Sphingomonas aurantiaca]PTQ60301.1 putative membrane protein [Sphingomonas aurantiaca]